MFSPSSVTPPASLRKSGSSSFLVSMAIKRAKSSGDGRPIAPTAADMEVSLSPHTERAWGRLTLNLLSAPQAKPQKKDTSKDNSNAPAEKPHVEDGEEEGGGAGAGSHDDEAED